MLFFIQALRIHISLEMKKALDAVGGFKIEHRGLVDVKVICEFIMYRSSLAITNAILFIFCALSLPASKDITPEINR